MFRRISCCSSAQPVRAEHIIFFPRHDDLQYPIRMQLAPDGAMSHLPPTQDAHKHFLHNTYNIETLWSEVLLSGKQSFLYHTVCVAVATFHNHRHVCPLCKKNAVIMKVHAGAILVKCPGEIQWTPEHVCQCLSRPSTLKKDTATVSH